MKEQRVDFSTMNDASVADFLKQNKIGLKTEEARKIQDKILKRPPSMTELVVWGIQGSEHSSYKSSKKYLKQLLTEGKEVILGPSEDSGIIKFCEASGKTFGLVLSHESHNHPSQVVPYEGSATGVGGIVRDVACMGSKVIALCDMLRFGDPDRNETKLIFDGVKKGISGYGNPIGVPNLSGEAYFDESYNENCLVNVSCVGLIESNKILHSYVPKNAENEPYVFILVGKPTDMSGFGGASFASADLDEKDKEQNKGAVQEPNPFLERHLLASFYDLFQELDKQDLFDIIGLKDLGAGGVLCATVELAESGGFGAEVFVEQIHKALDDLPPAVILCSETQERFCFAVPERLKDMFLNHFNKKWALPEVSNGAMASYIGNITHDGIYRAIYKDETVCEAKTTDITEGLTVKRPTKARQIQSKKIQIPATDLKTTIKKLLESVNIASREPIYENYDQTVQGLTVLERSEADAGLMCPLRDRTDIQDHEKKNAFSISTGGNPLIGKLSPYNQALYATLNAICKNAAVGTKTNSLTDCLNYGSAEIPEEMWEFAEGIKGLNETSRAFNIPFVSGNVSLYNRGKAKSVAPSCIISGFGVINNSDNARRNVLQTKSGSLYIVGKRHSNLSATEFAALHGQLGDQIEPVNLPEMIKIVDFMLNLKDIAKSASYIQEGGMLITATKMALRAEKGLQFNIEKFCTEELFSEFLGFVVEIENESEFTKIAQEKDIHIEKIATIKGTKILGEQISNLKNIWKNGLRKLTN